MITLTDQQSKEIAEELDCGFRAFCHKTTGELTFIIDSSKFPSSEFEEEEIEAQNEIDANRENYVEIEAMRSNDSYRVMADFTEVLPPSQLKEKLLHALSKRGPFREFKYEIDNSGDYREKWFAYRDKRYVDWVNQQLANYQDE